MLNKKVCEKCHKETGRAWGKGDKAGKRFDRGIVFCPMLQNQWMDGNARKKGITLEKSDWTCPNCGDYFIFTDEAPPKNCPYILEHAVSQ